MILCSVRTGGPYRLKEFGAGGVEKKVSTVRNSELKKSDVFSSLLRDLSIFLVAGLQIWFSLDKDILKSPLQEESCYKGIKKDFHKEVHTKVVNIATTFSKYTEISA